MLPSRFGPGQQSNIRKSKLDARPSLLPKPRRPGSTDRQSTETRRPSTTGPRSSSAEPSRPTFGGTRLSREASATKLPINGRSRSQQGDRYMTPLRSSQYSRPTTTPRTPSEDRANRSWQTCLERVLAFVTIKDERPVSNAAWQRAELARVSEGLSARNAAESGTNAGGVSACVGGGMALVRPLTIARFVDITGALLTALTKDAKLNTDNYVTKLPHLTKRLLYPGTVSKSWLKTVNTLHAFPHALALVAYLLDLVNHVELPVSDEWLYADKNELARLRRDYLYKCWYRFQGPAHEYEDLNEEYLQNLKSLLGNDDEKIVELQKTIEKYEECLEDKVEIAAREHETQLAERHAALAAELRDVRAERSCTRTHIDTLRHRHRDLDEHLAHLDTDIERASAERTSLRGEVEAQRMSVSERARLMDEFDYALRVRDSKQALAQQIAKMVQNKEAELALWQKKTLDSCMEYKQRLIHLSAQFPDLGSLAVDEKELMEVECAARVSSAVDALRDLSARLTERRAEQARNKTKLARKRAALVEETRVKISEVQSSVQREQQAFDSEVAKEKDEAAAWSAELQDVNKKNDELRSRQEEYLKIEKDLELWQKQEAAWRTKLSELEEYIASQREKSVRLLDIARNKRSQLVLDTVANWNKKL